MKKITLLSQKQIWNKSSKLKKNKLEILKKYGLACEVTDFALLLGCDNEFCYHDIDEEGKIESSIRGPWLTKTSFTDEFGSIVGVSYVGARDFSHMHTSFVDDTKNIGIRPVLPYSSIKKNSKKIGQDKTKVTEVLYGKYPQMIVDETISSDLEKAYSNSALKTTGKSYTTNFTSDGNDITSFKLKSFPEYEYKGEEYIRFDIQKDYPFDLDDDDYDYAIELNNEKEVYSDDILWLKVSPINWLIDEKTNIALCKKIILSGIEFDNQNEMFYDFKKSNIKIFMDYYLSKEILPLDFYKKLQQKEFDSLLNSTLNKQEIHTKSKIK